MIADDAERSNEAEPRGADLRQQAPLAGDRRGQDHIKGADSISRDNEQALRSIPLSRQGIKVTDLPFSPARQRQIASDHRLGTIDKSGVGFIGHAPTVSATPVKGERRRPAIFAGEISRTTPGTTIVSAQPCETARGSTLCLIHDASICRIRRSRTSQRLAA